MKKLALLLFTVAWVAAGAQEHFIIENGDIYWQKEYATSLTFKEVVANAKISGLIDKPEVDELLITGLLVPFSPNYNGAGYSTAKAPIIISNCLYTGGLSIKYNKEGTCTVSVKRIALIPQMSVLFMEKGVRSELREAVLKKGQVVRQAQVVLEILNYDFNSKFSSLFK